MLSSVRYITRHVWSVSRLWVILLVVIAIVQSLLPAALALATRQLVNVLVAITTSGGTTTETLYFWLFLSFGVGTLDALLSEINSFIQRYFGDLLALEINQEVLEHASSLSVQQLESSQIQDMIERVRQHSTSHIAAFLPQTMQLFTSTVQIVSLIGVLLLIDWITVLLLGVMSVPYFLYQSYLARRRYQEEHSRTFRRRYLRYVTMVATDYRWIPEVKLLNLAPHMIQKFVTQTREFLQQDRRLYLLGISGSLLLIVLTTGLLYEALRRLMTSVVAGRYTVGDVTTYFGVALRLRSSVQSLVRLLAQLREALLYIDDMRQLLATVPEHPVETMAFDAKPGVLRLEHVSYLYPEADRPALEDISFAIEPGETVALVGENGAGKTTLAKLIAGLYSPTSGRISYNGQDIKSLVPAEWYAHIGFVFQDFNRYEGSIRENIAYGDWQRLLNNPEAVRKVASQADLLSLINSLPRADETTIGRYVGEHNLSIGQWQKLAIARAVARQNALLFILDEPTASLDAQAEYQLFQQFRTLTSGKTTLLISHRFSTISLADRIVVLADGRMIEQGTHQDLMRVNGRYAQLYKLQSQQYTISS
jgi:ATP-binding cassette subfamily B protein